MKRTNGVGEKKSIIYKENSPRKPVYYFQLDLQGVVDIKTYA